MTCTQTEILLQRGLDGRLAPAERAALDTHLASCAACAAAWDEYHRLDRTAAAWARRTEVPPDPHQVFLDAVMAQIAAGQAVRSPRSSWQAVGAAACAVLALAALSVWAGPHLPLFSLTMPRLLPHADIHAFAGLSHLPQDALTLWDSLTQKPFALSRGVWGALTAALGVNIAFALRARHQDRKPLPQ